jgi:fatty acid desaturase
MTVIMNRHKIFTSIFVGLTALAAIISTVAYLLLRQEKPWLAFFIACCGGLLIFNFLISLFLVHKNFRKNR